MITTVSTRGKAIQKPRLFGPVKARFSPGDGGLCSSPRLHGKRNAAGLGIQGMSYLACLAVKPTSMYCLTATHTAAVNRMLLLK